MRNGVKRPMLAAAVVLTVAMMSGCAATNSVPATGGQAPQPRFRTVAEAGSEDDTTVIVTEPTSVTVMGVEDVGVGESIPVEELIEESAALGQDVEAELGRVLEEVSTDGRDNIDGMGAHAALTDRSARQFAVNAGVYRGSGPVVMAAGAYDRVSTWYDNKFVRVALRTGTDAWGWQHIQKHNVSLTMIQKTTKFPKTRVVSGTNIKYETPAMKFTCWLATCWVEKSMTVRVIMENIRLTDGYPKGVITTYCVQPTSMVCPQWVREVAG